MFADFELLANGVVLDEVAVIQVHSLPPFLTFWGLKTKGAYRALTLGYLSFLMEWRVLARKSLSMVSGMVMSLLMLSRVRAASVFESWDSRSREFLLFF